MSVAARSAAGLAIAQLCADRGIAPGGTKGGSLHLRGLAAGLVQARHSVTTHTARGCVGDFPASVQPIGDFDRASAASSDVIYERYSLGHLRGLELATASRRPFVLEVNAPLVDEARRHRPGTVGATDAAAERRLLDQADLVITVSSELTAWVRTQRSGPTVTIPNGFEPAWFPAPAIAVSGDATPSGAAPDDRARLVFLGHPKPWHGADRLPRLLADLAELGHRPELLIIGGGDGTAAIERRAAELGVTDQIEITGARPPEEASRLLATGAIGLAPYPAQRPFYFCPLKVVDYMAAGLAVVATAQGDIPTLVGGDGVLVHDPDDDTALAAEVAALLDDPDRVAGLGASARRRAHATMTWGCVATRTVDAISALVDRAHPALVG